MRWFWSLYGVWLASHCKVHMRTTRPRRGRSRRSSRAAWRQWLAWAKLREDTCSSYAVTAERAALPLGGSRRVAALR